VRLSRWRRRPSGGAVLLAALSSSGAVLWRRCPLAARATLRPRLSHSATGERVDPRYGLIAIGVEEEGRP
jgi:hypothetical protein